jgi:hypothetical protein
MLLIKNDKLPFADPYVEYPDLIVERLAAFNQAFEIVNEVSAVIREALEKNPQLKDDLFIVSMTSSCLFADGETWYEYEVEVELNDCRLRREIVKTLKKKGIYVLTKKESELLTAKTTDVLNKEFDE